MRLAVKNFTAPSVLAKACFIALVPWHAHDVVWQLVQEPLELQEVA